MKALALSLLLLSACTPAVRPTVAPSPISTAVYTATIVSPVAATIAPTPFTTPTSPAVLPLVAHEWAQTEPLITFTKGCGDSQCGYGSVFAVRFTLMPNGDLYLASWNESHHRVEILTTNLSRQETCRLLNSIDQAGFFDYDPATYVPDPRTWLKGPENTYISVHAWRARSVSLSQLDALLDQNKVDEFVRDWANCVGCGTLPFPTILPAISDTYRLLNEYEPKALRVLELGRLGVWIDAYPSTNGTAEWPLATKTLAGAIAPQGHSQDAPNMILTGTDASRVYHALTRNCDVCAVDVREGDKLYSAYARPLLPNEYPSLPLPKVSLRCIPSDGVIETTP